MTTFKDFPKLEDWAYEDLLVFYNKAIQWKIDIEKELREKLLTKIGEDLVKEILGDDT